MNTPILSFSNVGLAYRRKLNLFSKPNWVLRDISFDLYPGETLGVIGRNGAGKSTLLKLLADIISPTKGQITRLSGTKSQLLSIGLGFNKSLSGVDNTLMALVTQGKTIREAKSLVSQVAKFAELEHIIEYPVGTYSAGQKARLGFSTAIHATPDVLLLDEILGVGDKEFQKKSSYTLKKRVRSDQTVILVSHSLTTLNELCDRVLWIKSGSIKAIGDTKDIIERYNSEPS
ncbi:ABC transporter ATP-binding protein [Microbulbifer sp. TRSA002]|uniref:ABC transporter ATP-binding protein n=1 Tax=Microbulbifer sp. TRSA002 TaxID=3243382 RepID=UPI00403A0393